jgi:hypothetical protein
LICLTVLRKPGRSVKLLESLLPYSRSSAEIQVIRRLSILLSESRDIESVVWETVATRRASTNMDASNAVGSIIADQGVLEKSQTQVTTWTTFHNNTPWTHGRPLGQNVGPGHCGLPLCPINLNDLPQNLTGASLSAPSQPNRSRS